MAALVTLVLLGGASTSAHSASLESPTTSSPEEELPGVELAETLATATGIAITPLLGVSAVGAWHHLRADEAARRNLPWYTSTWFWIPGILVALLLVFKDPVLGWIPGAKKPLDALDVVENKASAVLATPAVIPMFFAAFTTAESIGLTPRTGEMTVSHAGLPDSLPEVVGLAIGAAVFLAAFSCIWLAFHAINVLILLSPFGFLDLLLRSVKLFVLVLLAGGAALHPYLGLAVALLILVASIPIAAWSFRLMVFGSVMSSDLLLRRHRRTRADTTDLRAFTAQRVGTAPTRTWGQVSLEDGELIFGFRPWLVLPRRKSSLGQGSFRLGRGVICPLLRLHDDDGQVVSILRFPPRYRTHERELAARLELAGVEDLPLLRGFKACFAWFREMVGHGGRAAARIAPAARDALHPQEP